MTKEPTKKIDFKNFLTKTKKFFGKITILRKKTWFFTIVFFFILLGFSLQVWWNCILHPTPSEQSVLDIEKEQKEFETKKIKVEQVIEKIKERNLKFQTAVEHQIDRKIFKSGEEIFQEMNPSPNSSNSSGINRLP